MRIVTLVVALVAVAVVALGVRLVRLQRHAAPRHCYGRALSTLISEQEELAKVRPSKEQRIWLLRYVFGPIRTGFRWLVSYVKYRLLLPKHKIVALDAVAGQGIDELRMGADGSTCVVITGDWADGSANSRAVGAAMEQVDADYTSHLGDIYSVGSEHEIERRFVGKAQGDVAWPRGTFGGLAVPGNHEYHSGAHAFYKVAMRHYLGLREDKASPVLPQRATYFCLRNPHWSIIGLDTGYHSVKWAGLEGLVKLINKAPILKDTRWAQSLKTKLPDEILEWLSVILADDSRAIIVLTHHQDLTTLDKRGRHPKPREQMSRLLERNRRILWLCGHGHRLEIHAENTDRKHAPNVTVLSRTVGHGAETDVVAKTVKIDAKIKKIRLEFADNRPAGSPTQRTEGGYPGFATLRFTGEEVAITYHAVSTAKDGSVQHVEDVFHEAFKSAGGDVEGPFERQHAQDPDFIGLLVG